MLVELDCGGLRSNVFCRTVPTTTTRSMSVRTHQRALHCFADFRCSNDAIRDHWFFPYFITAALSISSYKDGVAQNKLMNGFFFMNNMSKIHYGTQNLIKFVDFKLTSVLRHTPPLINIRGIV